MEGGKLNTWEKLYWAAFAGGMCLLAYNHLPDLWRKKEVPKVDEDKEARKKERARLILAGRSLLETDEDPFDGLTPQVSSLLRNEFSVGVWEHGCASWVDRRQIGTLMESRTLSVRPAASKPSLPVDPQEIASYVQEVTGGANASDPFEGMSPEEINDYIAKNGAPSF